MSTEMGPARQSATSTPPTRRVRAAAPSPSLPRPALAPTLPVEPAQLPERDIRSKRPPVLSFLLRMSTARRVSRVVSLLALDFAGVALAVFTALVLKEVAHGRVQAVHARETTEHFLPFAYLLTALLFARSGLYAERALRPGLSRIVGSLFQVAFVALIFAVVSGESFSSYYLFWSSLAFAIFYIASTRGAYEQITRMLLRAAGYRRRAVLVGRGKHIGDVAHALSDAPHSPIEVVGFLSPKPLPANGVTPLGSLDDLDRVLGSQRIDEVIIADPDFPKDDAVELVDQCHRRGIRVRLAPSTMEILIHRAEFVPGQSVPLFELGPPVFEGVDFALKRTFDIIGSTLMLVVLSPLLAAISIAVWASSRGPVMFRSVRRGIAQRPFDCLKFRTMHT
ncbi:MAG: sugar transferase, partial [Solirubrobacteraceae bacterium]